MFKWEIGRQNSGYHKLKLFSFYRADCYLLFYPINSFIQPHIDKVKGKHFRINLILRQAIKGGVFFCSNPIINWKRIKIFRADISEHGLTNIEQGTRLVLSIGFIV
jgi:hypothetical protein